MKTTSELSALPHSRRNRPPRERGVAIITVLAIVMLMTILIISFFTMAASEQAASQYDNDTVKARALADSAVNLVISQIRKATTQKGSGNSVVPWASQPGAIRTFDEVRGLPDNIFKLYSAASMVSRNYNQVKNQDVLKSWDTNSAEWVDMNEPVVAPNPAAPTNPSVADIYFPICDPRAFKGRTDRESVEGFSYDTNAVNGIVGPGNENQQRVPMPVRWLYVLQDGTYGAVQNGTFQAANGGQSPSKTNPVVGRIAFWTDDETCKVNVNTASEGVFWDTPRTSTREDVQGFSRLQPAPAEYQRYAGHPAMVSLSSVLYPNRRFRGKEMRSARSAQSPPGYPTINEYDSIKDIQAIWRLTPKVISGDNGGEKYYGAQDIHPRLGQRGNPDPASISEEALRYQGRHLHNSPDDLLFSQIGDNREQGGRTTVDKPGEGSRSSADDILLRHLKNSRFLLTSRSSAPEVTLHGTPRMSLWPISGDLKNEYNRADPNITSSSKFSRFDALIGFNSAIQNKGALRYPYYFQRSDPAGRHAEFYESFDGRNETLQKYVLALAARPIPGFVNPASAQLKGTGKPVFPDFADKYGEGPQEDLASLVGMMIDYIRNQNLSDPNLSLDNTYGGRNFVGQVTPICLCGGSDVHANRWYLVTHDTPKGFGRFITVSEVGLVISHRAYFNKGITPPKVSPNINFLSSDTRTFLNTPDTAFSEGNEFDVGLLVELFSPSQGWSEFRPRCRVALIGGEAVQPRPTKDPPTMYIETEAQIDPISDWSINNVALSYAQNDASQGPMLSNLAPPSDKTKSLTWSVASSERTRTPAEYIGWGGNVGLRWNRRMIQFRPVFIPGGLNNTRMQFYGAKTMPHPRLIIYDESLADTNSPQLRSGNLEVGNLIQCIPLAFPDFEFRFENNPGGTENLMANAAALAYENGGLPFPAHSTIRTMVPAHSDYRLTAARRTLINPREGSSGSRSAFRYPAFVPTWNSSHTTQYRVHSFRDPDPAQDKLLRQTLPTALRQDMNDFVVDGRFAQRVESLAERHQSSMMDYPISISEALNTNTTSPKIDIYTDFDPRSIVRGALIGGKTAKEVSPADIIEGSRRDLIQPLNSKKRGTCDPSITGDFDTGIGYSPDGAYINRGDDGMVNSFVESGLSTTPYYEKLQSKATPMTRPAALFSPNRQIPSAGVFGSIPTGTRSNVPWQTLLFRPDPNQYEAGGDPARSNRHYGFNSPKDHLLMDLFWMPIVEPYAISEPLQTSGKINMNYRIMPFEYINRATALHALFKAERITAIPNEADDYKIPATNGNSVPSSYSREESYRYYINAPETLKHFERRFDSDQQAFLTASEICDIWLIPQMQGISYAENDASIINFWRAHSRTGDNLKERPYSVLYPRLTTRSNTYKVHVRAQVVKQLRGASPETINPQKIAMLAEYRGSYLVERSIDGSVLTADPSFQDYATMLAQNASQRLSDKSLDLYYSYRISQVKQFAK